MEPPRVERENAKLGPQLRCQIDQHYVFRAAETDADAGRKLLKGQSQDFAGMALRIGFSQLIQFI